MFTVRARLGHGLALSGRRCLSSTAAPAHVKRLTMFKIPKEEDIEAVLKEYEVLRENAVKVSESISRTASSFTIHFKALPCTYTD
jgi:hypothetical protein